MTRASVTPPAAVLAALVGLGGALGVLPSAPPAQARQDDPARRVAEAIEKTLQTHAPEVHRCFEKALADRLDVAGDVEVEVEVGPAGKVVAAKLRGKGGAEAPPGLAACVEQSARNFVLTGIEAGASVVLPFSFQGQVDQFAVKVADVPERGPRAAAPKRAGGPPPPPPPFAVKLLIDPVNVRVPKAALTLLTIAPKNRVAMHRHPGSAKALYLLAGRARLLGPTGAAPILVDPGTAIFVPRGYPHALETLGTSTSAVFLQIFSPPGPERVYRDPSDPAARAAFEVVRDGGKLPPSVAGATATAPVVAKLASAPALPAVAGKGTAKILLDPRVTGSPELALAVIELPANAAWPRHSHDGASELLYVAEGGGTLEVGSEKTPFGAETALFVPDGQPHAMKFAAAGPTRIIQIFAPAGPGQPAGAGGGARGSQEESSKVIR